MKEESRKRFFTSESVTEGHPDKVCDQIADAILDDIFTEDPSARVAVEVCATTGMTEKAIIDVRKRLEERGMITCTAGVRGRKAPVYSLLYSSLFQSLCYITHILWPPFCVRQKLRIPVITAHHTKQLQHLIHMLNLCLVIRHIPLFPLLNKKIGNDPKIALKQPELILCQPGDIKHMNSVIVHIGIQFIRNLHQFFDRKRLVPSVIRSSSCILASSALY